MNQLSHIPTAVLLGMGIAAAIKHDIATVMVIDAEMQRRKTQQAVMVKDDEFFTMESKQETMKVLKRVMA